MVVSAVTSVAYFGNQGWDHTLLVSHYCFRCHHIWLLNINKGKATAQTAERKPSILPRNARAVLNCAKKCQVAETSSQPFTHCFLVLVTCLFEASFGFVLFYFYRPVEHHLNTPIIQAKASCRQTRILLKADICTTVLF